MKSIAVLFFAMTLVIAFIVASGMPHINEIQVIRPEKQAYVSVQPATDNTYIIGVSAERGAYKIIKITVCLGKAGMKAETELNS
jgi:hypothetical protein